MKPWTPHKYQVDAAKFLISSPSAALFADPGLGKTSIALSAIKAFKLVEPQLKTLVIAPKAVCYLVWPQEIQKWTDFHNLTYKILHGKFKADDLCTDSDIYIINPEGLKWLFSIYNPRIHAQFGTLIFDELSKFKSAGTLRHRLLKKCPIPFKRRWGLTGSPRANGLMGLFGQFYALDRGATLGRFITHYRNEYFYQSANRFTWTLRHDAETAIYLKIAPITLRLAAKDYIDLPEMIETNIPVALPPSAKKIYKELEREFVTEIQNKTLAVSTVAAAAMKCQQVANGAVYADDNWVEVHSEKIEALQNLIDELQGAPIIVAYTFQHDLKRLVDHFGMFTPFLGAGVTMSHALKIAEKWNEGKIPILLANPQSWSHGLNLQNGGNHICWFSMTWDYEIYDQLICRVLRQGSNAEKVFVYRIVAEGTLDLTMVKVLEAKREGQDKMFVELEKLKRRTCDVSRVTEAV